MQALRTMAASENVLQKAPCLYTDNNKDCEKIGIERNDECNIHHEECSEPEIDLADDESYVPDSGKCDVFF